MCERGSHGKHGGVNVNTWRRQEYMYGMRGEEAFQIMERYKERMAEPTVEVAPETKPDNKETPSESSEKIVYSASESSAAAD